MYTTKCEFPYVYTINQKKLYINSYIIGRHIFIHLNNVKDKTVTLTILGRPERNMVTGK